MREPDAVVFACPKCGTEVLAQTGDETARLRVWPPYCQLGHGRTEMEQVFLGANAYRRPDDA